MIDGTSSVHAAAPEPGSWCARSLVSGDVDEHAANLSGWRQEYDQLSGGGFTGRLDEAVCDGVQVFRERTSQLLRQRCEVWPGALWIGITEADDGSRLNGRRVGATGVMACGTDGTFELVSPVGHSIIGFVVSRALLASRCPALQLPTDVDAHWWSVDAAQRHAALVHARAILVLAGAGGSESSLRGAMLDIVAGLLTTREPPPRERGNAASRRRLVAQAHERIEATPDRAPSVPELCAALHVSRRTLQYAFEEEAGVSPLTYIRSVRLNGVRRLLRHPTPGITVHGAAAAWGYWNPSAFAADYRRQFGERASETLARSLGICAD